MNLCRCEKGHFYDKEKYATCPHCIGGSAADDKLTDAFTEDVTSPVTQPGRQAGGLGFISGDNTEEYDTQGLSLSSRSADEQTVELDGDPRDMPTVPLTEIMTTTTLLQGADDDDDHTIGIYDDYFVSDPTARGAGAGGQGRPYAAGRADTPCVGWLVALGGEHIGTDFRLKAGKNFIGRSSQMDVALTEDKSVSRERHGIVVYEPKAHLYLVQPGESSSLVYRNDEVVLTPVKLEAYDVITVGDVNLLFMPLCGTRFNWGDLLKKMKEED